MKQTKDIEYHKKILKLGVLKLEESKVHREAIVKLMAPLNLLERKEIQREMDKFFLEDIMEDGNSYCPVWKKYRNCAEKKLPPRRNSMVAHYDWFYLSIYRGYLEEAIKDRQEERMKRLNERRKRIIKLV
tara:strand:+ start:155 stop:544 length:390 start_codon:yes stop_codon:yes gene_type:complete